MAFDFGEGFGAALADGGVTGVFADVGGVVPATVTFFAVGVFDFDGEAGQRFALRRACGRGCVDDDLGNDEERG